jgi:hypothetical protein
MGGSGHGLARGTIAISAWMDWGKPQKSLVRIVSVVAKFELSISRVQDGQCTISVNLLGV